MEHWIQTHQYMLQWLIWPLVTALVTGFFKPRTPAEYSAMPPRLAAILKLIGAIGFDAPKMLEAAHQIVTGKDKGPQ